MAQINRRELMVTTAALMLSGGGATAGVLQGSLPWWPGAGTPPEAARPGPWLFFTADEAATIEALVDRLIPPDPETPGGKDSGCAVFIDRQLAGPYGYFAGLYRSGPFLKGTKEQGQQSEATPRESYRAALTALNAASAETHDGQTFAQLPDDAKDEFLRNLEAGKVQRSDLDGKGFFEMLLKDTREGFFADPIYGGNRDMVAWKMIGFPGARYDYRDWVTRHNEPFPLPPVSIAGRKEWVPRKS